MKNKLCAYSTCNDAYVPKAAASLLGIRKWNPDIPLYIIGRKFSAKSVIFLKKYDIKPIELDLSKIFYKSWQYPVECYYLFAGPEVLLKEGFSHSLYIDGDVYCNKNPLIDLNQVKMFAGVSNGGSNKIFGDDYEKISAIWPGPRAKQERLQSGVLYFNNKVLAERKFLSEIGDLFDAANKKGIPRKGDDSLFSLYQYINSGLDYHLLPRGYNYIEKESFEKNKKLFLTKNEELIQEAVFFHFTLKARKPWDEYKRFNNYTVRYFSDKWRHRLFDSFAKEDLREYFPELYKQLQTDHLRFYWYPTKNVGDLVTPYFLTKVCGVKRLGDYSISEKEIKQIQRSKKAPHVSYMHKILRKLSLERSYPPVRKAEYCVSTGSVIRLCQNRALVFGSGIRSSDQEVRPAFIRSVRGPLTRGRFIDEGYRCPPIYGDPGLLLPHYYKPKRVGNYRLGIIPHFTEFEEVKKLYVNDENVIVIDMGCGDLEKVINQIYSCAAVVSSSLHGLVFCHAYKVPTCRIIFSNRINGDGTKFQDYYLGINAIPSEPINASGFQKIAPDKLIKHSIELIDNYDDARLQDAMFFDKNGFKQSAMFPY